MTDHAHPLQQGCSGCGGPIGNVGRRKGGICMNCAGKSGIGPYRPGQYRQCLDCDTMILKSEGKKVCDDCRSDGAVDMYRHGDYRKWRDEPDLQSKARRMGRDGKFTSRMLAHVSDLNAIEIGQQLRRAPWAEHAGHNSRGHIWWRYVGE